MKISILEVISDLLTMNPLRPEQTGWQRFVRVPPLAAVAICIGSAVVFTLLVYLLLAG